eukprot:TRINITY_DN4954_c0_g1_i1.p1 TRINITY_DN4954_c0_g1~~TRINITY_DN4954_c0_g1_i1.p1  ORF type:complete len:310 (-),score=73.80 TRINITY_DN4954_c0_g1_i1:84-1013(-)
MSKTPSSPPQKEKKETFNQLDERFQLTDQHDPEHIFPDEYEMIAELRRERPELEKETDKFLVVFLCARRHNIPETIKLLDKYTKKRTELGLDGKTITVKDDALRKHLETGVILNPTHCYDKYGRIVSYIYIAKNKPKDMPLEILYEYGFWETQHFNRTCPLKNLRNGCTLVVDFKGFGLSNVDLSSKGIEFSKALSGVFPKRIRKAYIVNGGWLLQIISKAATLLLSKKLVGRMEVGNSEGLKTIIDEDQLLVEYGGKLNFVPKDMVEESRRQEDKEEQIKKQQQAAAATTPGATTTTTTIKTESVGGC